MIENVLIGDESEDVDMDLESAPNDDHIDKSGRFHPCGQGRFLGGWNDTVTVAWVAHLHVMLTKEVCKWLLLFE